VAHLCGQVIDQMAREYEAAKDVDVFRRYGMLKRTVKRTIMHLRLHQNSGGSGSADDQTHHAATACSAAPVSAKTRTCRDELRKRTDHVNSTCPSAILDRIASSARCGPVWPGLDVSLCVENAGEPCINAFCSASGNGAKYCKECLWDSVCLSAKG